MSKTDKVVEVYDAEGKLAVRYDSSNSGDRDPETLAKESCAKESHVGFTYKVISGKGSKNTDASNTGGGNEDDEDEVDYATLKVADLKAECETRKIEFPEDAKKADLVALLEKYDEDHKDEPEE